MAKACVELGHDVEVWAQAAPPETIPKDWPFKLRRLPIRGTHDLSCQIKLARELIRERRNLRYATVYLPEPGPMLTLMALQFVRGFMPHRLILTFHGSEVLNFDRWSLRRWLTRRFIKHAWRISTLTHYTKELLCSRFPEATEKAFITPGALRTDFNLETATPKSPKARLVVLTVGRLHPRKGQLLTLQALQALPSPLRDKIEFWIVGTDSKGEYEKALRATAQLSDLKVSFIGDLSDNELDGIYDQADIFALTSIDHGLSVEGFGLVYLEASAHALPVVAHDVGGVSEAVLNGETGLLVSPSEPLKLTAAFAQLIEDPALRKKLGVEGRRWALKHRWLDSAARLFKTKPPTALS